MITPTIKPEPKQQLAWNLLLDNVTTNILFGGGAGGGKSWLGCEWLLTQCYFYPGSSWFIGRNELKRLKLSTYRTWKKVCKHHGIPDSDWRLDGDTNSIRFLNGSTIDLLDVAFKPAEDPDYERFGSLEYTGGFGEEVSEWHFDAYDTLNSRIGRNNIFDGKEIATKFYATCNPSHRWPYRIFYAPWKSGLLPAGYAFIQSLYTDNSYTAASYGKQLANISNPVRRARLKSGDWEYEDDANALTTIDALTDMFTNTVVASTEKYLIVDVARKGVDRTVFNFFKGLESYKIDIKTKQGTDITEQQIKDFAAAEMIPFSHILVDEDGIGGGVVDHLPGIKGFTANSVPVPTDAQIRDRRKRVGDAAGYRQNYANLKAQCGWKLAELINEHKIAVRIGEHHDQIIEEISATLREKDADSEKRLRLIPKEEVKEALGRSPDIGDTFLMRAFFEVQPAILTVSPQVNFKQNNMFLHNAQDNSQFEAA
jgi:phage terminase large subunit